MRVKTILLTFLLNMLLVVSALAQEMPLVYGVENTGADCAEPPLPSKDELPTIEALPDPFMWSDTTLGRIATRDEWRCRRAEIAAELQYYELGTKPEPPDRIKAIFAEDTSVTLLAKIFGGEYTIPLSGNLLIVTIFEGEDSLTLYAPISLPDGEGPFPAVIGVGFSPTGSLPSDIFTDRGIATIQFMDWQVTDAWSYVRGDGPFFELYPDSKRGKFVAFAWAISRIIDGLERCPEANIDLSHLAVTGCSYAGKIALFSGALDERIALTIPQEPGGGGDAAWRVSETLSGVETLRNAQGQYWYYQNLSQFNNAVTKLPYDHHEVMAMIAPRALLLIGNPDMVWLAEESGHVACKAAHEVWKALGVPDRFGFSKVGHGDHCVLPISQKPEIIAFVGKFLLGNDTVDTNGIAISPYDPDLSAWITWNTPELIESSAYVGDFHLEQNNPNPFNSVTTIGYYLDQESYVRLSVFNVTGREIRTFVNNELQSTGKKIYTFDGNGLPSGVYICTLKVGEFTQSKKMLLIH